MDPLFPELPEDLAALTDEELEALLADHDEALSKIESSDDDYVGGLSPDEELEGLEIGIEQMRRSPRDSHLPGTRIYRDIHGLRVVAFYGPALMVNGVVAAPGIVGEFYQNVLMTPINLAAGVVTTVPITVGLLQPGDWDVEIAIWPQFTWNMLSFSLVPLPAGFSNEMQSGDQSLATGNNVDLVSPRAQASISVPTLVVINTMWQSTTAVSGNALTTMTARRMR